MATVPELQGPRVLPSGPDAPAIRVGVNPEAFGTGIARSAGRLAGSADELVNAVNAHQVAMQQIQNAADADDRSSTFANVANDIATDFTVNQRGGNALPALEDYKTKIQDARNAGSEGLNPVARKMYEANTRRLESNFLGSMSRHAGEQNRQYTITTATAAMDNARSLAVAHPDDPEFLHNALDTIEDKGTFLQHYEGMGDEVGQANIQKEVSKLFSEVITQKANDNPIAASQFFEDHKSEMRGEDIARMDSFLTQRKKPYIVKQMVDNVTQGGSPEIGAVAVIKSDPKGFFSRKLGDGITINSTERSEAHNAEVGGVTNSYHIAKNGYAVDIGPGTSGKSIAQLAAELKKAGLGATEIVPEPAKNHVHIGWSKADLQAKTTPGVNLTSARTLTELEGMRLRGIQLVDEQVKKVYGDDPQIRDMAETEFDSRYNRMHAALAAFTETAKQTVIAAAMGDDGTNGPTSLEALQRQPGVASSWQYLDAGQQKGVMQMLKRNANPTISQFTSQQFEAFQTLDGESKGNPAKFAQRDPLTDPTYAQLPNSYRLAMMKRRDTILAGQQVDGMTNRALQQVSPLLKGTEYENNAENADSYNKFASKLSDEVKAYYDIHKKAPSQVEVRSMAQELMLDKAVWGGTTHTLTTDAASQPNFVPAWFQAEAAKQAQAHGVTLTPEQVAALYQRRTARVR